MTDNTQELDEILDKYAKAYYEAKYESRLNTCEWATDEAKQAILDWHNKQVEQAYSDGFMKASKGAFKSKQVAKREAVEAVLNRLEATFNDAHIDKIIEAERNKLKEGSND